MYRAILKKTVRFLKKEDGPTAVEYAVMLALIIVVCIFAITALGSNATETFGTVALNASAGSWRSGSAGRPARRGPLIDSRERTPGPRPGPQGRPQARFCSDDQ